MISIKMMKNAALRNLQRYATTEHIFGIGMATKKTKQRFPKKTNFSSVRTNDRDNEKREFLLDDEDDVMWER